MKILVLYIFLFLTIAFNANAQGAPKKVYPNSFVDLSAGVGMNYGMAGVKTVIGYKGTGLYLGTGTVIGEFGFQFGFHL